MLLQIKNLEICYGKIPAVRKLNIGVEKGQIIALIGSNGAGKGVLSPSKGQIYYEGKEITKLPSNQRVPLGIALVPEGRQLFSTLTVKENLRLGAYHFAKLEFSKKLEEIYDLFPIIKERENQIAGTLSGGEQQMLAFGRAIISNPRLLLLDEPSLGLAPLIINEVYRMIEKIKNTGITIILVEQNIEIAFEITNYIYVLEAGELSIQGTPSEVIKNNEIKKAYFG